MKSPSYLEEDDLAIDYIKNEGIYLEIVVPIS
jgi:hypothetical protein